jgi:hypothetical protein
VKLLAVEAKMETVVKHLQASHDAGIGGHHEDPTVALRLAKEVLAEIKREHARWRDAARKRHAGKDGYCC